MLPVSARVLYKRGHHPKIRQAAHQDQRGHTDRYQPEILRQEDPREDHQAEQENQFLADQRQPAPNDCGARPLGQVSVQPYVFQLIEALRPVRKVFCWSLDSQFEH
jgi:hypothetical protein